MSYKIHLLKRAKILLEESTEEYHKKNKCGDVFVRLKFFQGGITGLEHVNKVTEK